MDSGSPPCSPQMPIRRLGLVDLPLCTASLISSPTPVTSSESNGSWGMIPSLIYSLMNFASASSRLNPRVICVRSFDPTLKKSQCWASCAEIRAALGTSIMVPTFMSIREPLLELFESLKIFSATSRTTRSWLTSSSSKPTRGIMIEGYTATPSAWHSTAASMMAAACMAVISGWRIPRRQPLSPIMGFVSFRPSSLLCSSLWARMCWPAGFA
mmetsp:Transcript_3835/g.10957  ORF Transcript_3835/g.10957 Transcript_3835/m.10957 type:complete len:213 (+) Transcript_3835:1546-2184(+)